MEGNREGNPPPESKAGQQIKRRPLNNPDGPQSEGLLGSLARAKAKFFHKEDVGRDLFRSDGNRLVHEPIKRIARAEPIKRIARAEPIRGTQVKKAKKASGTEREMSRRVRDQATTAGGLSPAARRQVEEMSRAYAESKSLQWREENSSYLEPITERIRTMALPYAGGEAEVAELEGMNDLQLINWLRDKDHEAPGSLGEDVRSVLEQWDMGIGYASLRTDMVVENLWRGVRQAEAETKVEPSLEAGFFLEPKQTGEDDKQAHPEKVERQNLAPPPEPIRIEPQRTRRIETFDDLLDDMSDQLKENGRYQVDLTGPQLDPILRGITESLISRQRSVKGRLLGASIDIKGDQGFFEGAVQIESPVKATISVSCGMRNDLGNPGRIQATDLDVQEKAGIMAKAALRAFNARGKVQEKLGDLNRAFRDSLSDQLATRGVKLTEVRLHLEYGHLRVVLSGEPLQRR